MKVLEALLAKYNRFRRATLPQSIADAQWRHEELSTRLIQLEALMRRHVSVTCPTSAEDSIKLQQEIRSILRLLEPQKVVGFSKKRVGSSGDGGYVQIDHLTGVTHAFSFGVNDDDSWDLAMAEAGVPVEQFDHSIESAPSTHPLLRFHRKMIAPRRGPEAVALADLVTEYSSAGAPSLFLKMDIEGSEWDVLDQTPDDLLARHTQILVEFHGLSRLIQDSFAERARRVFTKLDRLFAVTHVHGNNCAGFYFVANIPLPDVLEISFANRAIFSFEKSDETFPTALDAPNSETDPDYALGAFRF